MCLGKTFDSWALVALTLLAALGAPCILAASAAIQVERQTTGLAVHNGAETLHITVCGPTAIHIVAGPGDPVAASSQQPWIVNPCQPGQFEFSQDEKEATLSTSALRVTIGLTEGNLAFKDSAGKTLLMEPTRSTTRGSFM